MLCICFGICEGSFECVSLLIPGLETNYSDHMQRNKYLQITMIISHQHDQVIKCTNVKFPVNSNQ